MGRSVKCCSCKGLLYYLPWSSMAVAGLLAPGAFLYLLNSNTVNDNMKVVLQNVDTESTVSSVLPGFDGMWIVTLALAATCLAACLLTALFRTHQKCMKNYDLGKTSGMVKRMRCCQLLELLGTAAAMAATAWFVVLVGFTASWLVVTSTIAHAADQAADKKGSCSKSNSCWDTSSLPFWDAQQCLCDTNTLRTIQTHAEAAHDANVTALIGAGLLALGGLLATAVMATAAAATSKNKGFFRERHDVYMGNKPEPGLPTTTTGLKADATGGARGLTHTASSASFVTAREGGPSRVSSYTSTYSNPGFGVMAPPAAAIMDGDTSDNEAAVGEGLNDAEERRKRKEKRRESKKAKETDEEREERRRKRKEKKEKKRPKSSRRKDGDGDEYAEAPPQVVVDEGGPDYMRRERAPWELDDTVV